MKIPRFLAFGSSLSGLESKPKAYRLVGTGLPRVPEPKAQELPVVASPTRGSEEPRGPQTPFSVAAAAGRGREKFVKRLWGRVVRVLTCWLPEGKPLRTAIQTELRLDAVRPIRSRLIDDDLEVFKRTRAPTGPSATISPALMVPEPPTQTAPQPFERAVRQTRWNRLSGWFRPGEEKVTTD